MHNLRLRPGGRGADESGEKVQRYRRLLVDRLRRMEREVHRVPRKRGRGGGDAVSATAGQPRQGIQGVFSRPQRREQSEESMVCR